MADEVRRSAMREKRRIYRTRGRRLPAMWEYGGGYTNTGDATIITDAQGRPKRPLYIRRAGHLACDDHALFVVRPGDCIVEASHHRRDFYITISRIEAIDEATDWAEVTIIATYDMGEWDRPEVVGQFAAAVEAAMDKAACYHCREPHYYVDPETRERGIARG